MNDAERRVGRPTLCLVTPGARPASPTGWPLAALLDLVRQAIDAGIDLVQLREPQLAARELYDLSIDAVRHSRGTATRIIVNDRFDIALAAGADGVHLGRRSLPPARVRAGAPAGFLIGCSIHALDELPVVATDAVDYAIVGTVYATASKPADTPLLGVRGVASLVRHTDVPLLAIGGVTLERIPELAAAGAAGIAAIGLFADAAHGALPQVVAEARGALTRFEQFPKLRHAASSAVLRDDKADQ